MARHELLISLQVAPPVTPQVMAAPAFPLFSHKATMPSILSCLDYYNSFLACHHPAWTLTSCQGVLYTRVTAVLLKLKLTVSLPWSKRCNDALFLAVDGRVLNNGLQNLP